MGGEPDIVLVRHGETEWSASGRHTSYTDVPLTDRGREQARALAPRLVAFDFAVVLTSPRQRARDTCVLAGLGDRAQTTPDLAEWDYGEYEGKTTEEIRTTDPAWTIFRGVVPGGETADDVTVRADRILDRVVGEGGAVALFSHGHFLRVLGARWVGLDAPDGRLLGLDTGTICVLGHEREQRVLRVWNEPA